MTHASRSVISVVALFCLAQLSLACGGRVNGEDGSTDASTDGGPPSTIEELPVDETLTFPALEGEVNVVRDVWGVPHLYGDSLHDVYFVQGVLQAMDRFLQMHIFRMAASGRVAELGGGLSPELALADLQWRMFGLRSAAEAEWAALDKSSDYAIIVQAFSDGVDAYADGLRSGEHRLPAFLAFFKGISIGLDPWTPVDTLTVANLLFFNLSYDHDRELLGTTLDQLATATFDAADPAMNPELAARAGAARDFWSFYQGTPKYILPGIPNMPVDTGTVAAECGVACLAAPASALRPVLPRWLLDSATRATAGARAARRVIGLSAHPASNNFVISGDLTADGFPVVGNDPHLDYMNPSLLWMSHLNLDRALGAGNLDVAGIMFPGAPGVAMGFNRNVGWAMTYAAHDNGDFYAETIVPCAAGGGDCVLFEGGEVPLVTGEERITLGLVGTPVGEVVVAVESVPHHGPILPYVDANGDVLPRSLSPDPSTAMSVRWTGFDSDTDMQGFIDLFTASSVADVENAVDSMSNVAVNIVAADDAGDIYYTAWAHLPVRGAGAMTWDPVTNPGGTAPMFVLPGDGTAEWLDGMFVSESFAPHALNPAAGFIESSNNDPIGATDDGNPINDPIYVGWNYDIGFRGARMAERILAASGSIDLDEAESIQADAHSALGPILVPHVAAAVAALEQELLAPGMHPDLADLALDLSASADLELMRDAEAFLAAWTFDTPAASAVATGDPAPSMEEIADSAATMIFNAWLVHAAQRTFFDELGAMGFDPLAEGRKFQQSFGRALLLLFDGTNVASGMSAVTGDPILFDDLGTPALEESKNRIVLEALREAVLWLESPPAGMPDEPVGGFGSSDPMDWRWGDLHTLRIPFPLGDGPSAEDLPPAGDADFPRGYPRHGENFTVDVANHGIFDLDFTYIHGAVWRMVVRVTPDGPEGRMVIPGGQIFDADSPHYDDDVHLWRRNLSHPMPFTEAEVLAAAESRILLTP